MKKVLPLLFLCLALAGCLPPADPYPYRPPAEVVAEAEALSANLEAYIKKWLQGEVPAAIPDSLIPQGIEDSQNFYLKHPDSVTAAETWGIRLARPVNKDSLLTGIPDPQVTYLYLGTALAPFGSKLVLEGEFPHCRFFTLQITPPLNGVEYYAQRQFGTAEVSVVDADIEPLPGHTNPFRPGASRNAVNRSYRIEFDLTTGNPTTLNGTAHQHPYRRENFTRKGALWVYQGPLGHKTVAQTALTTPGDWNLGALWVRIYQPDDGKGPLGGVSMPKAYFELPGGEKYFIGSDFSRLQERADKTIANRTTPAQPKPEFGPHAGWYKSWGITRSMLNGICQVNGWSRIDSSARVREIDLAWTGRGEFQPPPGNIEPHATTNNYCTYLGRRVSIPKGYVAVLTGRMPTFPSTRNGEPVMGTGEVRYWSICGIDDDALSPLPATTIHAVTDDEVVLDQHRNYVIVYSRTDDRPANAIPDEGVTWVNYGTQADMGLLMRWVNVAPHWTFAFAPQEHNLSFSRSDWSATQYDSTLLGVNWRNGFLKCYQPVLHLIKKSEFEALGGALNAEKIPAWIDSSLRIGPAESRLGMVSASSLLDQSPASAAHNALDGNLSTGWSSAFGQQNAHIDVDLGSAKLVSGVKLFWDWIFFARNYTVEHSLDGVNWTTLSTAVNENGQIDLFRNFLPVSARYVRLNLTQYNAGWYRLIELEVYTNDCKCEAPPVHTSEPRAVAPAKIWPNPARGTLYFSAPWPIAHWEIYDLRGTPVASGSAHFAAGETHTLPLSNELPAGAYIVRFTGKNGESNTRRFVTVR